MKLLVQRYYGGFYETYIDFVMYLSDVSLMNNIVLWLADDDSCSAKRPYVNLLFVKNTKCYDCLLKLCLELRLSYICGIC